jgi:hypothetical protein
MKASNRTFARLTRSSIIIPPMVARALGLKHGDKLLGVPLNDVNGSGMLYARNETGIVGDYKPDELQQLLNQQSDKMKDKTEFPEVDSIEPTRMEAQLRIAELRMFDAYQHFLFYFEQSNYEAVKPHGDNLTAHFASKLNGLRNRKSPGCNSTEVLVHWMQEMSLGNQEVMIDYMLKYHVNEDGTSKWGRGR